LIKDLAELNLDEVAKSKGFFEYDEMNQDIGDESVAINKRGRQINSMFPNCDQGVALGRLNSQFEKPLANGPNPDLPPSGK